MTAIKIPVFVGALSPNNNCIDNFKQIPVQTCLQEIQKVVLTSTAHILRRILSM